MRRRKLEVLVLLVLAVLVIGVPIASSAASPSISVFFLRGEQLASVMRAGSTPTDAVRQLIAGPTRKEFVRGFRTYLPAGTTVHRVTVTNGLATVDLGTRFTTNRERRSLLARLSQVVRTLTAAGAKRVQLLIDGARVSDVFPGVPTASPVTFGFLQTPNVTVPKPKPGKREAFDKHVKAVQARLIALGYLPAGSADGRFGPVTQEGILAFQKWERLKRSGTLDRTIEARLRTASHPTARTRGPRGRRAEILIDRQVALLIVDNNVVRTIAVSSGKPSTPTPPGSYRVYAKITRWWSVPFREWLPWAVPFVGGIAFHEFPVVPTYPASHGCVRQSFAVAHRTYDFAEVGMPVQVIARSPG
jgi:peptidoglycan hydrolase-like protein with peptidoglycan-binding domain